MRLIKNYLLFPGLVELACVVDIVPDGVETAGDRDDGVPECITHPDPEYCVFLAKCLTGLNAASDGTSGKTSGCELYDAA